MRLINVVAVLMLAGLFCGCAKEGTSNTVASPSTTTTTSTSFYPSQPIVTTTMDPPPPPPPVAAGPPPDYSCVKINDVAGLISVDCNASYDAVGRYKNLGVAPSKEDCPPGTTDVYGTKNPFGIGLTGQVTCLRPQ
jgi:hypothetical protein